MDRLNLTRSGPLEAKRVHMVQDQLFLGVLIGHVGLDLWWRLGPLRVPSNYSAERLLSGVPRRNVATCRRYRATLRWCSASVLAKRCPP